MRPRLTPDTVARAPDATNGLQVSDQDFHEGDVLTSMGTAKHWILRKSPNLQKGRSVHHHAA